MSNYQKQKDKARQKAIDWQNDFNNKILSWDDLCYIGEHLEKIAKRYGLIKEFKENGII